MVAHVGLHAQVRRLSSQMDAGEVHARRLVEGQHTVGPPFDGASTWRFSRP
jgi:hypothetical protein